MQDLEFHYRKLYIDFPDHDDLKDQFLLLHNVYDNYDKYKNEKLNEEEKKYIKLLNREYPIDYNEHSVVTYKQFKKNWKKYTCDIFNGMEWDGIYCAGGAIVNCINNFDMDMIGKDIDLYLCTDNKKYARECIKRIYNTIRNNYKGKNIKVYSSDIALTFSLDYPYKDIQVITARYTSPAELLLGFDIDACSAAYNGSTVWATDRFKRAMNKRYNLVDKSRRSETYEQRLYKYSFKGFYVLISDLSNNYLLMDINTKKGVSQLKGLYKLLKYNDLFKTGNEDPYKYMTDRKNLSYSKNNNIKYLKEYSIHNVNNLIDTISIKRILAYYKHPIDTNGDKLLTGSLLIDNDNLTMWENTDIRIK